MNKDIYTDYQKKTIAHILDRFMASPPASRILCSDEVGLGKTFVAKGVIRGMAWHRLLEGRDRLDVLYLCPNLNIAAQNKKELGIPSEDENEHNKNLAKLENRSSMLYLQVLRGTDKTISADELCELYNDATGKKEYLEEKDKGKKMVISIFPVTPDTSIKIKNEGDRREREYILRMLVLCGIATEQDVNTLISDSKQYEGEFSQFEKKKCELHNKISAFRCKLEKVEPVIKESIQEFLKNMSRKMVQKEDITDDWIILRSAFARATVLLIPYDLVIMDEFQNFTDIIRGAKENVRSRDFIRIQREVIWWFLDSLKIENEYIQWLEENIDGFSDLVKTDVFDLRLLVNKCSEKIYMDIANDIQNWKGIEASSDGEKTAIQSFREIIDKMLQLKEDNTNELLSNKDHGWNIVTGIMDGKICFPDGDPDILDFSIKDEIKCSIEAFLNEIYEIQKDKNFSPDPFEIMYVENKRNPWRLKRLGNTVSYSDMENLIMYISGTKLGKYDFRGTDKEKYIYSVIKDWAFSFFRGDSVEDDGKEKLFFRIVLMNLVIYRRKKVKGENILPEYYLWEHLRDKSIENREISFDVFKLWYRFSYKESRAQRTDFGTDTTAEMIDQIFSQEVGGNARILMLSATPFKLYMGEQDEDEIIEGSTNKETVDVVCDFLQESGKLAKVLNEYKSSVKVFAASEKKDENLINVLEKKSNFEKEMTAYFTRMERNSVTRALNAFRVDDNAESSEYVAGRLPELLEAADELAGLINSRAQAATYAKQIPYALSFMPGNDSNDGYKAKTVFLNKFPNKENEEGKIHNQQYTDETKANAKSPQTPDLTTIRYSLLDKSIYDTYGEFLGAFHGVFRIVLYTVLDIEDSDKNNNNPGAGALLWIPPLVTDNERKLQGVFQDHYGYGKSIIFSAWTLIPRGLSTLISYEVRRRLFCTVFPDWMEKDEKERREIILKIQQDDNNEGNDIKSQVLKAIDKRITALQGNNNDKEIRKWKIWLKLIGSDISALLAVWSQTCVDDEGNRIDPVSKASVAWHIKMIEQYSDMGCLDKVFEEYEYLTGKKNDNFSFIKSSELEILFRTNSDYENKRVRSSFFARGIGSSTDDDKINAIKNLQDAFNSPFAPFVFSTTSMGQEGLNFHYYADKVIHWNLPSNPVDFEQREGRINRRNCFVIRRKMIEKYLPGSDTNDKSVSEIFNLLFEKVKKQWVDENNDPLVRCGMIPNWILPYQEGDNIKFAEITRIVPYFAMDDQVVKFHNNLKILQLYRSVIGQPDPEELLERLIGNNGEGLDIVKQLFLDFSPYKSETKEK